MSHVHQFEETPTEGSSYLPAAKLWLDIYIAEVMQNDGSLVDRALDLLGFDQRLSYWELQQVRALIDRLSPILPKISPRNLETYRQPEGLIPEPTGLSRYYDTDAFCTELTLRFKLYHQVNDSFPEQFWEKIPRYVDQLRNVDLSTPDSLNNEDLIYAACLIRSILGSPEFLKDIRASEIIESLCQGLSPILTQFIFEGHVYTNAQGLNIEVANGITAIASNPKILNTTDNSIACYIITTLSTLVAELSTTDDSRKVTLPARAALLRGYLTSTNRLFKIVAPRGSAGWPIVGDGVVHDSIQKDFEFEYLMNDGFSFSGEGWGLVRPESVASQTD